MLLVKRPEKLFPALQSMNEPNGGPLVVVLLICAQIMWTLLLWCTCKWNIFLFNWCSPPHFSIHLAEHRGNTIPLHSNCPFCAWRRDLTSVLTHSLLVAFPLLPNKKKSQKLPFNIIQMILTKLEITASRADRVKLYVLKRKGARTCRMGKSSNFYSENRRLQSINRSVKVFASLWLALPIFGNIMNRRLFSHQSEKASVVWILCRMQRNQGVSLGCSRNEVRKNL